MSQSATRPFVATQRRTPVGAVFRRAGIWIQATGLDAVAVALVWQDALGRIAQQSPLIAGRLGLALVVAFIYILDRHLDATRAQPAERLSARHRLHARFPGLFRSCLFAIAIAILGVLPAVRWATLEVAAALAGVVAIYLAAVQLLPRWMRAGAKELTVGLVFAAGCAAHALPRQPHHALFPTLGLTGLLFALNCLSISTREAKIDAAQGAAGSTLSRSAFVLSISAVALTAIFISSPLALPIVASSTLLAYLHLTPRKTALHHLLADAALLTPLLLAWR